MGPETWVLVGDAAAAGGGVWTPEGVFTFASRLALPGWILLAVLPRWKGTGWIVHSGLLPALLAALYAAIVIPSAARGGLNFGDFGTLDGVVKLFSDRWVVAGGWIHYLAFDLMVGAWEVRDSQRVFSWPVSQFVVLPCLVLTLMLGPVGLLTYLLIRWSFGRRFEVV